MDEALLLRQVPHSVEAEQSVLGAMLIDPRCIPQVIEELVGEDFYLQANRDIYNTMYRMFNFSAVIDPVTVLDEMKLAGVFDENTSRSYILQLMDVTPTSANVMEYVRIVKDKSLLRQIYNTAGELTELVREGGETASHVLDLAEQRIYSIRQGRNSQGLEPLSAILVDVFQHLQELSEAGSEVPGLASGFIDLDRTLTGIHPSELVLLAARPGMGKTSFALNVLLHAGKFSGKTVVFFSLEMSREQLALRLISSEAYLDNKKLLTGRLSPDDWDNVSLAVAALSRTRILIDDNPALTVADMNAKCRRVEDLGLVVIDYLQLMQASGSGTKYAGENRQQVVADISRSLKIMAKELHVPVLCLSQLSRANESRTNKRPMLSALRESGAIEQDADVVMFLYREDYYNADTDKRNQAECIIAKNRRGETTTVPLTWLPEFTSFSSAEHNHDDDDDL